MNRSYSSRPFTLAIAATIGFVLPACDNKRSAALPPKTTQAPAIPVVGAAVLPRVAKEISDILQKPVSEITMERNLFSDLGADSLDAVEIVMALEEEFSISIDDASAERMRTVADIVAYIEKHPKP